MGEKMPDPTVVFGARRLPPPWGGIERWSADMFGLLSREFRVLDYSNRDPVQNEVKYLWSLGRRLRKLDADGIVVDGSDVTLCWPMADAAAPTVVRAHGRDVMFPNPVYQALVRRYLPRTDIIVANSGPVRDLVRARGVPEERVTVIHPASDPPPRFARRPQPGKVLYLGRLVKKKGTLPFLRNVWPELAGRAKSATLHVVGDGRLREEVERVARAGPAPDRIVLHGAVSREALEEHFATASVLAMGSVRRPNDFEGFGIVAIEAACRGLPVVANDVDGVGDAVIDGVTGRLVDESRPGDMAEAIRRILQGEDTFDAKAVQDAAVRKYGSARLQREYAAVIRRAAEAQR